MKNQPKQENKKSLSVRDILLKHLPAAGEDFLSRLEEDIKELYGEKMGYRLQWRTRLLEALNPEDANLPKEQQRVMFRFEVRAGDFADPTIEIDNINIHFKKKEGKG